MILRRKYNLDIIPGGLPLLIRVSRKDTSSTLVFSLFAGKGVLDPTASHICITCGREFKSNGKNPKYCSRECYYRARRAGSVLSG